MRRQRPGQNARRSGRPPFPRSLRLHKNTGRLPLRPCAATKVFFRSDVAHRAVGSAKHIRCLGVVACKLAVGECPHRRHIKRALPCIAPLCRDGSFFSGPKKSRAPW